MKWLLRGVVLLQILSVTEVDLEPSRWWLSPVVISELHLTPRQCAAVERFYEDQNTEQAERRSSEDMFALENRIEDRLEEGEYDAELLRLTSRLGEDLAEPDELRRRAERAAAIDVARVPADVPPAFQLANTAAARCRTYSSDETRVSSTGTMKSKCAYNSATNEYVCHQNFSGGSGPASSFVMTIQFGSVADFVGDPSKVSFYTRAKTISIKYPTFSSAQTYTYDARGYLTKISTVSSAGAGGGTIQTFTAWDALGRPTMGRDETQTYALTYDDAQRVVTLKASGLPSTTTVKMDANGNQVESKTVSPKFGDTTTVTIHATQEICK